MGSVTTALALLLALATLSATSQAHGMHGMHEMVFLSADASSTTTYKCPACGMSTTDYGYDNANYVELMNGQRIYTCGMDPRAFASYSFEVTDTAYVAANMAEFVVNETSSDFSVCSASCSKCADGNLTDPISGAIISDDSFEYVCLTKGQKIYFASVGSKKQYIDNVNQAPRYLVNKVICSGSTCSDAKTITTLSAAASSFVYQSASSSSTSSKANSQATSSAETDSSGDSSDDFCSGGGSVMFNGFQSSINGACVMLFFHPWVLNSAVKYFFGFIGCFLLALFNEYLALAREKARKALMASAKTQPATKLAKIQRKLALTVLYMLQMTIAYFAMLVVMTYETGLFCALLAGFGAGYLLFKNLDIDISNERGTWRYTDSSTVRIRVGGMSCMANCGTTVENALRTTSGVTNAYVDFPEQSAYVAGVAPIETLIAAIEAVGFSAELEGGDAGSSAHVKKTI